MAFESVGESLVSKIAALLVEPVIKQFRYMFCFKNFVQEFIDQVMSLALALSGLQDAVNVARNNAEVIEIYVNKWLEDAKKALALYGLQDAVNSATKNAKEIENDVNKWLEGVIPLENEKGKNGKCFTWCPKWIRQFKLSKALEKETETLRKLEEKSKEFQKVSHKAPLQDIEFLPSKEFTPSESSKEALEQIMEALKDDNVNMIGLYGMGGVGKTTLVKEVGRRAKETQLFDEVLLATVSQNLNVTDIQDRIADRLRLQFDVKTKEGRADLLWQRLKKEKKLLVILDDVWKVVNLKEIGIPFGLRDEDSNLNTVAKKVVRECQGLPIALVTVGRALRGKSVVEWEVASRELKNSQLQHMELIEDYNIPIEDLMRVGYGLHQDVESIEDTRKQVHVAINTLKDCCMLLGTEFEGYVKMHDLVRDVAIQIASSKEHGFMVKAGIGLKEWPRSTKSFESCKTISLMGNKLTELPEGLVYPQLKVLLLELDDGLNVPERFFEGMKEIEVLSLEGGCLSLQSLEFSTNLQSLLLIKCKCNDLICLRKLQRLEILCFIWCSSVKELPDEIGELKELRLLDVTGCILRRIPVNLIGRLKRLEELLIGVSCFEGWGVVGCDRTGGMNASLTELNLLSHLAVLSLNIPRVECIPRDFVFPRLLKYDIVLGNGYSRTGHPTSTRLNFRDISAASLNAKTFEQLFPTVSQIGFRNVEGLESIALSCDQMTSHGHGSQKDFLQRLEDVEVYGCRDTRTVFPAKWRQALNNITRVEIDDCESLEEIFELGEADEGINEEKELRLLSSLTRLVLRSLPELKCIWKGLTRHVSLRSLIHLDLWSLHKLTFIFTPYLAQSLVHLETLRIHYCSELKHLISEKDDEREIIPESLGFLKLKTLFISGCDELEYVFPVSVSPSLLNLEEMDIEFGANLKQIFLQWRRRCTCQRWHHQLPSAKRIAFFASGHTNLREIHITDCKGAQDRRTGHELSLLSLETLHLLSMSSMPDMRCIWKGLVLSHLTSLKVCDCRKLTHVFTGSMVASLVQLNKIVISDCEELEQIIAKDNDDEKDQILSEVISNLYASPICVKLISGGCNKLRSLFPVAMASGLPKLERLQYFGRDDHASPVNVEKQMVLPNLSSLRLDNLPTIVCFSLGCDDFLFPRLEDLIVDECPKLTTKFANKTNGSMSTQLEVSQSS
ncbi:hypothetical protein OIU85_002681 [Salix viminalis]|uniref:AAA+ ATPase domain-containing protein n=1 Tax=Salix viminalis TaxID=40686 RepID=A0A9Q0ZZH6_SALVM|nr:hypothetical protein OIU85_002681 [Salix viminalis]